MSICDDPDTDIPATKGEAPDLARLYRALDTLLRSPLTGQAVARVLACHSTERDLRAMVADLRARRAWHAYEHDADLHETAGFRHDQPRAPWARQA